MPALTKGEKMLNLTTKNIEIINKNPNNWFKTHILFTGQYESILAGTAQYEEVHMIIANRHAPYQLGRCVYHQNGWVVYIQGIQENAYFAFRKDGTTDEGEIFGCIFDDDKLETAANNKQSIP